jgi:hypothetical protein
MKDPADFVRLTRESWGKDTDCLLDIGTLTYEGFRGNAKGAAIVIQAPDGTIVHRGTKLASALNYYPVDGEPSVIYSDFQKAIAPHLSKSLLAGLEYPEEAAGIVDAVLSAKYAEAVAALQKMPESFFKKTLLEKLEALRKTKLDLFNTLKEGEDKWAAYKVGESYLRCFPETDDTKQVKKAMRALAKIKQVKKTLKAKKYYEQFLELYCGKKATPKTREQFKPAMAELAKKFPDTEYGQLAKRLAE